MTEEIGKEGVSRRGFMQTTGAIALGAMAHFTILNPAAKDVQACDERTQPRVTDLEQCPDPGTDEPQCPVPEVDYAQCPNPETDEPQCPNPETDEFHCPQPENDEPCDGPTCCSDLQGNDCCYADGADDGGCVEVG